MMTLDIPLADLNAFGDEFIKLLKAHKVPTGAAAIPYIATAVALVVQNITKGEENLHTNIDTVGEVAKAIIEYFELPQQTH